MELDRDGRERYSARKVDALRRHGRVVYLHRPIDYLEERVDDDENRPALSGDETFQQIMKRRDPWYRRAADHVIECGERSKGALAREILDWFYRDQKIRESEVDEHRRVIRGGEPVLLLAVLAVDLDRA